VCIGSVYVRDGNGQVLAYVYCEDEPSSLFMAGEEALPMLDLEPEENWLRCECAAAPSAAGHGCLVGVELTALCRARGGRWRGFGALTHVIQAFSF
jgi:hypothetical protein